MVQHLACIMDGNRRWAKERGLFAWQGHQEGVQALYRTVQACLKHKVKILSVYALSVQNLSRSQLELSTIFSLVVNQAVEAKQFLVEHKIRIRFLGDQSLWPDSVRDAIESLEQETFNNSALQVNLLFCYGAQEEIVDVVKRVALGVKTGLLGVDAINKELFENMLWVNTVPPDLIIRTGGERRLSNFLLYQAAYSELYFLDSFWPDITEQHIEQALSFFNERKRRFGV